MNNVIGGEDDFLVGCVVRVFVSACEDIYFEVFEFQYLEVFIDSFFRLFCRVRLGFIIEMKPLSASVTMLTLLYLICIIF